MFHAFFWKIYFCIVVRKVPGLGSLLKLRIYQNIHSKNWKKTLENILPRPLTTEQIFTESGLETE